ncbi:mandelate dehydrogenase [Agrobacterium rhizogenes]|uniref:alpha-hydroxy-acid oxidizing protein n=1 Tax=Rhizobium rhizogenes TaxID=359 RepID=UPI00115C6742|nr:alpha-hydroxy-acid oxidizing protein [Rhizobium rhizogenes]NTF52861.1 mandelate dehydrogenase [Rhizobium rhizogenes]NTF65864.1 mandelate dehydrogenase [Rhizobium rhizogenes]NTF97985.1 mandelate dehydrogenase [Rhizobium rhizogenes]NTG25193.1 mandelate dehydrogenase [Rhizobium rhizogenes]NTG39007.1 mandelate dehydrogenase [Rhizobium rhizogenes]
MGKSIKVEDYRHLARRRLPKMVFDYLDGGAEDEYGLRHNRDVFLDWHFKPSRLIDVSRRDLTVELFGQRYPLPFMIGPTGLNGVFRPKGDLLLAQAAARLCIPFVLSTASNLTIEEVASNCDGELWFQLYVVHRDLANSLTDRALAAGYKTLVLTTDVTVNGYRERDMRSGFGLPLRYTPKVILDGLRHPAWSLDLMRTGVPQLANFRGAAAATPQAQAALMSRQMDASFSWEDLARLRDRWPHRLLVKGILRPEDAQKCVELGADGVILSNHGGRQVDSCLSPMEVLSQTARLVTKPILIDSGFRRGGEIVKALALGAKIVLLGRATLYGLAARGSPGIDDVLSILRTEIDRTLALIGCNSVAQLSSDFLVPTFGRHNEEKRS